MKYQKAILLSITISLPVFAAEDNKVSAPNVTTLDEVSVIGTREAQSLKETALSIGVVKKEEIEDVKPAHPSEIMQRIPGVHVNVTGGEGHMTAIRQPITTQAVYLYLEDGIPTRSTGFFNHNALYEINLPQAERIEVLKGPGSALYGSDAIGGVINVDTKASPLKPEADVSVEVGEFGWKRLLLSGGNTVDDDGYRASINLTHTDGWRDSTEYDRQSATLRWDRMLESGASLKTVLSTSNIDQQTAGSSRLSEADYLNNPTKNYTPISLRKVGAARLSVAYEKETSNSLLNITPYMRSNSMELLPNWSLGYDPTSYETKNNSLGLQLKYRKDFDSMRTRFVTGVDVDYSPGSRNEKSITVNKTGDVYDSYTSGATIYDYDVTYQGLSPYAHVEFSPLDKLRLTVGLRYDYMSYDYDNKLTDGSITVNPFANQPFRPVTYLHAADTSVDFDRLSPKLGLTYQLAPSHSGFISYREAFRAPSEGQLFRPGGNADTTSVNLQPIKVASIETGVRGKIGTWKYDASLYSMKKTDDIVRFEDPITGDRENVNAGETLHEGIEVGIGGNLASATSLNIAASYAKHSYVVWVKDTTDYSGNEMSAAPRLILNSRLGFTPAFLNKGKFELEWEKLGSYWMNDTNTEKYEGHDLLHLRVNYFSSKKLEFYGRIMNVTDERYATNASISSGNRTFAPGMPRTAYAGMKYKF